MKALNRIVYFLITMDWNFFKRWFRDYTIILILTALISLFLNLVIDVEFSENTLLWMTSTIAQAFGALMAIVIAIGLFEKGRNTAQLSELVKERVIRKHGNQTNVRGGNEKFKEVIKLLKEQSNLSTAS